MRLLADSGSRYWQKMTVHQVCLFHMATSANRRNMYGPLPNCKKNRLRRTAYPASYWRVVSGRMMSDPRVPVLPNRHHRERPRYAKGFQARRLTVFRLLFLCRLLRSESQKAIRLVGKVLYSWLIVVAAGQNCPTDSGQLVGVATIMTLRAALDSQSAHSLSQTGAFAFDA
jgi:hypothetical protein